MPQFTLLPLLVCLVCTIFAWALRKYAEIASVQRARAGKFPRSRPYPLTLPASLPRD